MKCVRIYELNLHYKYAPPFLSKNPIYLSKRECKRASWKFQRFMCVCVCLSDFAICTSVYRVAGGAVTWALLQKIKTRNISFHLSNIEQQLISFRSVRSIHAKPNESKRKMQNNKEQMINLLQGFNESKRFSIEICACEFARERKTEINERRMIVSVVGAFLNVNHRNT